MQEEEVGSCEAEGTRRLPRWVTAVALAVVAALGFWVRLQLWTIFGGVEPSYLEWATKHYFGGITSGYLNGARAILAGDRWPYLGYTPGYSAFLALVKVAGPDRDQLIRLVQAAVDSTTVIPLWVIARRVGVGRAFSFSVPAVYAVAPFWAFGSVILLAEALSPMIVAWLLAGLLWARERPSLQRWVCVGALVGISALIRADLLLLAAPSAAFAAAVSAVGRRRLTGAVVVLVAALPPLIWGSYNLVVKDHFVATSTSQNYALWAGLGQVPNDYGYFTNDARAIELLRSRGLEYHSVEAERYWRDEYRRALREHPSHVARTVAWRVKQILFGFVEPTYGHLYLRPLTTFSEKAGFVVLLVCVAVLLRIRRFAPAFIVALPPAYATASLGIVYHEPRYTRYVAIGYLLAAVALADVATRAVLSRVGPHSRRALTATAGVAVLALAVAVGGELSELRHAAVTTREEARLTRLAAEGKVEPVASLQTLEWTHQVPGVELVRQPEGQLKVVTNVGRFDYQVGALLQVDDLAGIALDYTVTVSGGQVALGVLAEDATRFLATRTLPGTGAHQGSLIAPVKGSSRVTVVLMNSVPQGGRSKFEVTRLQIAGIR